MLKTKGTTNSDVQRWSSKHRSYFKALLGLAKVVIVLVILFGSCASLPGNQTFGWPQSISYNQTFSIDLSIT